MGQVKNNGSFLGKAEKLKPVLKHRMLRPVGVVSSELFDRMEDCESWISKSWIQEEFLHIDVMPQKISLPRRYAFRYLQAEVIDTSSKYGIVIDGGSVDAVSAVDMADIQLLDSGDMLLDRIDRVGAKTLMDCMQSVFEDGPKRDRRLWLGDLRLQALASLK